MKILSFFAGSLSAFLGLVWLFQGYDLLFVLILFFLSFACFQPDKVADFFYSLIED